MPRTLAPDTIPPEEAQGRLREGNRRFVSGEGTALRRWHPGLAVGQWPFAAILGCADSRAPAEFVFDQGLGDLFVIRVAGNIVAPSLVGSVEFAVSQFGTRLVVVMGHTHCGAVEATVHALEHGGAPESPNQQAIVDLITPHIEHVCDEPGEHGARVDRAIRINALASAQELRRASPIMRSLVERGHITIVSAVFDLTTGIVAFQDDG